MQKELKGLHNNMIDLFATSDKELFFVNNKKTLRDLPAQVDSATTTDEIKAVWNDLLGDK